MKEQTLEETSHQNKKHQTDLGGDHPPEEARRSHKTQLEYKPWHHEGYKWQKPESWRQPRTAYHRTEMEAPIAKDSQEHQVEHINKPVPGLFSFEEDLPLQTRGFLPTTNGSTAASSGSGAASSSGSGAASASSGTARPPTTEVWVAELAGTYWDQEGNIWYEYDGQWWKPEGSWWHRWTG